MAKVSLACNIYTNITDTYMDGDTDDAFLDWLETADDSFSLEMVFNPDIAEFSISSVELGINYINHDHTMILKISVQGSDISEDDLLDSEEFINFLNTEAIPAFIKEFNRNCNIKFPMSFDDDFNDILFAEDDFFVKLYNRGNREYQNINIKTVKFALIDDGEFEIY